MMSVLYLLLVNGLNLRSEAMVVYGGVGIFSLLEQIILHMKSLIITLLKVSQIESGMTPLKKESIFLNTLLLVQSPL